MGEGERDRPAIAERRPDVLEVGVAHIRDGEDDAVLVLVDAGADQAEQPDRVLFALFFRLREVHDLGALGAWHCVGGVVVGRLVEEWVVWV